VKEHYFLLNYQASESMDLFTEVIFSHEHLQAPAGSLIDASQATLGASNPFNPFGEAVE